MNRLDKVKRSKAHWEKELEFQKFMKSSPVSYNQKPWETLTVNQRAIRFARKLRVTKIKRRIRHCQFVIERLKHLESL